MLALEREEHAFGRLVRGLVSRWAARREGAARRARGARRDARGARRDRRCSSSCDWGRVAALGRGAAGRRAGVRRDGRGDRRARARGARRVAAGDPRRAAVRVPRAHPQRRGRRMGSTTSCGSSRRCSRSSPALDAVDARRSTTPSPASAGRSRTWRRSPSPDAVHRARGAAAVRVSIGVPAATRLQDGDDGDPPAGVLRPRRRSSRRGAQPRVPEPVGAARATSVLHARRPGARDRARRSRRGSTARGTPFAIVDAAAGDRIIGRIALANVVRGVWQNATLGYWVERRRAAAAATRRRRRGSTCGFAFEHAGLHRVQPAVMPRNARVQARRREGGFRHEGVALRYLQDQRHLGGPRHLRDDDRGLAGPAPGVRT